MGRNFMTRYKVLMALFLIGMLITGGLLLYYGKGYLDDRKDADNIREIAYGKNQAEHASSTDPLSDSEEESGAIKEQELSIDFAALIEKNSDTVGWLFACGGLIDGPIVQTTDNDFYLNHRFDKSYGSVGCFFADAMLPGAISEAPLTVIYGHNRKDGSMFRPLLNYKDEAYFLENPTFTIYTEKGAITYQIFSAFFADNNDIYGDAFQKLISDSNEISSKDSESGSESKDMYEDDNLRSLIQEAKEKSLYECMKEIPDGDLVILSTCEYSGANNRMVVYGIHK